MVKVTLEENGEHVEYEGEFVLAFIINPKDCQANTTMAGIGAGVPVEILDQVSKALGSFTHNIIRSRRGRVIIPAKMIGAFVGAMMGANIRTITERAEIDGRSIKD